MTPKHTPAPGWTVQQWEVFATSLHKRPIQLGLARIQKALAALGDPQQHLAPIIHVSGTNGKGSTVAFLRALLTAAGYRVHTYTSPHLIHINERIRLNNTLVTDTQLCQAFSQTWPIAQAHQLTLFEWMTLIAFQFFHDNPADIILLEVGLGGRLDATNVIPPPLASVITPISLDHAHILGQTCAQIAREKAGIIKPGSRIILAPQEPEVQKLLQETAALKKAHLFFWDWNTTPTHMIQLRIPSTSAFHDLSFPLPQALLGEHQHMNAATAIATTLAIQETFPVEKVDIDTGLAQATWPGRLQKLSLPEYPNLELWIDGAHNAAGIRALTQFCDQTFHDQPLVIAAALLDNRPPELLLPLLKRADKFIALDMDDARFHPGGGFGMLKHPNFQCMTLESFYSALSKYSKKHARILLTGSLYMVGKVLRDLNISIH